ncbi:hypothetical protein LTR53_008058 [Teratosphaeriaceae sp. CCFEE 6253]|nr:hypothetical protein LTR53_008058 [Teratosphaeriaceae sp. CCFEE 6253]
MIRSNANAMATRPSHDGALGPVETGSCYDEPEPVEGPILRPIKGRHTFFNDAGDPYMPPSRELARQPEGSGVPRTAFTTPSIRSGVIERQRHTSLFIPSLDADVEEVADFRMARWLNDQGLTARGEELPGQSYQNDDEEMSDVSEQTVRPTRPQTQVAASYFSSDVGDPTVAGPASTVLPEDPQIARTAGLWQLETGYTTGHIGRAALEYKMHLEVIAMLWGGRVEEILPTHIRPLKMTAGVMRLVDILDWDQRMVKTLRKVAPLCTLKHFVTTMESIVMSRRDAVQEWWMSFADVQGIYEKLKTHGIRPRTLADVRRSDPALARADTTDCSNATAPAYKSSAFVPPKTMTTTSLGPRNQTVLREISPSIRPAYNPRFNPNEVDYEKNFCCEGCTTYFESGSRKTCRYCKNADFSLPGLSQASPPSRSHMHISFGPNYGYPRRSHSRERSRAHDRRERRLDRAEDRKDRADLTAAVAGLATDRGRPRNRSPDPYDEKRLDDISLEATEVAAADALARYRKYERQRRQDARHPELFVNSYQKYRNPSPLSENERREAHAGEKVLKQVREAKRQIRKHRERNGRGH